MAYTDWRTVASLHVTIGDFNIAKKLPACEYK